MLKRSPIKYVENLLKDPPLDIIIKPRAIAVDEKTPITVSAPVRVRFLMYVIKIAKAIEKIISEISGEVDPNKVPIAIPVNAPCPSESEKKAILFDTTIVESKPNNGVTKKIAMKPLIIN